MRSKRLIRVLVYLAVVAAVAVPVAMAFGFDDGVHPPEEMTGRITLTAGIHRIRVSYFQGPRFHLALILRVAGPGEPLRVFSTDEFKPPANPENWKFPAAAVH